MRISAVVVEMFCNNPKAIQNVFIDVLKPIYFHVED